MTAYSGFLAVGSAIVDGVLAEVPGVARLPVAGDATDGIVTLPPATFASALGTVGACGILDAPIGGNLLFGASIAPAITIAAGQALSFPPGPYAMAAAGAPGADILTIEGAILTLGGQPVQFP